MLIQRLKYSITEMRFSSKRIVQTQNETVYREHSLSLRDILPIRPKQYDKNRAPKYMGQPTIVYFHVTVLSLDSINEESMASLEIKFLS